MTQPERSKVPSFSQAAWIAMISPWQVGSCRFTTMLWPTPTIVSPFTITAPKGPPSPASIPFFASAIASFMYWFIVGTSGYYLLPEVIFPALEERILLVALVLEGGEQVFLRTAKMSRRLHFDMNIHVAGVTRPEIFDPAIAEFQDLIGLGPFGDIDRHFAINRRNINRGS